jgi:flavin reductase (DIM6/NTAB) family NADH-FMN oxidoreductase RutF
VVVVTSLHENRRFAMTATAVSELSFDPPSMLICVNRSASVHPALAAGAPFGINILHQSHRDIAGLCAGQEKSERRFELGDWREGALGVPRLEGAQASIFCRNSRHVEYGTHGIFIGDVIEVHLGGSPDPLIYLNGGFVSAAWPR